MTSYNSTSKRSVGFSDYWWFIVTLIPFVHWLPLFIAGIKTKKAKWVFWGILYLSIFILTIVASSYKDAAINNEFVKDMYGFFALGFFVSWVIAIFHTFGIKKEYLYHLSQIPSQFVQTTTYDKRTGRHTTNFQRNLGKHGRIIANIEALRNQINTELKKDGKNNVITDELGPIVDKYVVQTKELAKRDAKIEMLLKNSNSKEFDFKIRELKRKIDRTDNAELMQQYMDSISSLEQNKKMFDNFEDQREVIRLRMDGAQMELKKIKMNLISMENLSSQDQNTTYVKDFETKSHELTTYLELLKEYK